MANKKITELTLASPSSSASVVGEDGGVAKRFPVSSFGGGGGIIYASELPSTPEQTIYVVTQDEVKTACYQDGVLATDEQAYCEVVDELPENPIVAMDLTTWRSYAYYLTKDNQTWIYVDQALSDYTDGAFPVGWTLASNMYVVTSTSVADMPAEGLGVLITKEPKTRAYVPTQDGSFKKIITEDDFEFDATTGTLVLNL